MSAYLALVCLPMVVVLGCSDEPQTDAAGLAARRAAVGKADMTAAGSCRDSCGDQSADGECWCDTRCEEIGDCCSDLVAICGGGSASPGCKELSSPPPDFCPGGKTEPVVDPATGCVTSFTCASSCKELSSPPPDFCPGGKTEPVVDPATGCVTSFECVPAHTP